MRHLVRLCCALSAALFLNIAFSASQFASGATFNVNNTGDTSDIVPGNGACADSAGACTLRAAIQEANAFSGNDTITISVTGTINLTGALPDITSNITLDGPGSSLLTVRRDTGGDYRIFFTNNVNVNISGLTITNGRAPDSYVTGGGILQAGGSMTLTDVVITGNRTGDGGTGSGGSSGAMGGFGGGIAGGGILTMTKVVVSNNTTGNGGTGYYGGSGGFGGGIYFSGSALTMTNVVVSGNTTGNAGETTSGSFGGHGGYGGGIYAAMGTLNMSNVTVSGNTAGNGDDGGHGGGIYIMPDATTTMRDSTISNNSTGMGGSKQGAQGGFGGGIVNHGQMIMVGCLISGNTTKKSVWGSGGGSLGGGIFNGNTLKMINCTVSGNHADPAVGRGGGIFNNANALTLTNVTITGNTAYSCCWFQHGQGIHNSGVTNVRNSIIAGNGKPPVEMGNPGSDVTGLFNSQGNNIIGRARPSGTDTSDSQSGFTNGVNSDQVGTIEAPINPQLGPLASNGGPTRTHALLAGSPALDKGNNSLALDANNNPLTTDQRGSGRFADSGGTGAAAKVDIGAYEFHPFLENVSDKETKEDTQLFLHFNIGEADANPTSVTASSGNQTLVPDANLSITGTGPVRTLGITPAANVSGVVVITLTVNGSGGSVKSDTFQLTITPVNDAPAFTLGANQIVSEDAGALTVANWATGLNVGPNESGQSLSFIVASSSNPGGLFSTLPSISPDGTLTYALAANASGSAVVTVSLRDDGGTANGGRDTSDTQTFTITVLPVNDAPVAVNNNYGLIEDMPLSIFAPGVLGNDTDIDFNPLTAELVSAPNNGSLTFRADGSFTYTPSANFNGTDAFTYRVRDGNDWSNVATVSLVVSPVNDAPVNTVPTAWQIAGTTPLIFSEANANLISIADIDAGPNPLRITLAASNGTLTLKTTGGLNFSTGDGMADSSMVFTGSVSNINAALDGLSFTPRPNYSGLGNVQIVTNDLGNTGPSATSDADMVNITILPGGLLQFGTANYQFSEGAARAVITITRTGDATGAVSVSFATVDDPAAVPCDPTVRRADGTTYPRGLAYARCDYATTIGTVTFAAGDRLTKTINVPLVDDAHDEGAETLQLKLLNATGAFLGTLSTATLTINDNNDAGVVANPILSTPFFVRMQYLDFLSREPEAGEPWSDVLNKCSDVNNNPLCDRITVSQSFFGSPEFRLKGFYAFSFYRVAFDRRPTYEEIIPDMRSVTGATEQEVYQQRAAFTVDFTGRTEFKNLYGAQTDTAFVNALLDRYGLQQITAPDPANPESATKVVLARADLISRLGASGAQALTRAQVLRAVVESNEVGAAEYNRAFVAMQYYGYLRRTPEEDGYQAWLKVINQDPNNVRIMVDGFMNSTEYKLRFGRAQ